MNLIRADMKVGTVVFRNFGEKLFKTFFQHLSALLGVHCKTESILKISGVPWHVDFRHDSDSPLLSIGNHLSDFIVCVVLTLVAARSLILRIIELRINPTLDAPCRIIGQVPMEIVQLVETHQIECFLQLTDGLVVAPRVVHKASERICGPVVNFQIGNATILIHQLRQSALRPIGIA